MSLPMSSAPHLSTSGDRESACCEKVIHRATLDNLSCFREQEVAALNIWEAHSALNVVVHCNQRCQIHGVFELMCKNKSQETTLPSWCAEKT